MTAHLALEPHHGHPVLAAWCAGPAFLAALAVAIVASSPAHVLAAASVVVALPFAMAIGFFVAIVPNLLCTFILRGLAQRRLWLRRPAIWGVIGALLAGGTTLALSGDTALAGLFAASGAVSALVCRRGIAWPRVCPTQARRV
jgi:hypothetical protein